MQSTETKYTTSENYPFSTSESNTPTFQDLQSCSIAAPNIKVEQSAINDGGNIIYGTLMKEEEIITQSLKSLKTPVKEAKTPSVSDKKE